MLVSRTTYRDGDGLVPRPPTLGAGAPLLVQIHSHLRTAVINTLPARLLPRGSVLDPAQPARAPVPALGTTRPLGGHPPGRAQEEDVALQEEAQADGRQGPEGRYRAVQMPSVWGDQEDASPLPQLLVK